MTDTSDVIDALGLRCPLPVLRLRKVLANLPPGTEVTLLADDPVAVIDVPHFCAEAGHELLTQEGPRFRVRRGPARNVTDPQAG